jgi:hypothetical protein
LAKAVGCWPARGLLLAGDELLGVVAGGEDAAVGRVPEPLEQGVGRGRRRLGPTGLAGGLAEAGEGVDEGGVVGGVGQVARLALPRAAPAAVDVEVGEEELGVGHGGLGPVEPTGGGGRLGQGREEQGVPLGEHLVVEPGAHAGGPALEQCPAGGLDLGRAGEVAADRAGEDVAALEVAGAGDAVPVDGDLAADLEDLVQVPDVELPLDALGVGVLGRAPAAAGGGEVAEDVVDGLLEHLAVAVEAGDLPGVEVDPGEEGLVVEHLLEVGDEPAVVDRVAGEAAAKVVVDAARGHGVEREDDRLPDVAAQEQVEAHRLGELGCPADAAPRGVDLGEEVVDGLVDHAGTGRRAAGADGGAAADGVGEAVGLLVELAPLVPPRRRDGPEQRHEPVGREVGAAVERPAVGGEEHRHRPPAAAGHGLDRLHVDGVDVGPLLPVDLHVHEQLVHDARHRRVLERLVRHHVAPVAGRVPHRQQDRHVPGASGLECLVPPREPVHGVLGMLPQVRARLHPKPVHAVEPNQPVTPPLGG